MPKNRVLMAMAAILGAGLLFLIANVDLPIVRNSFVYAKTALNIIDHGFNPLPIIADTTLSHGKPVGFSLLSVPFVSVFGVNAGLKLASFLGTAFFLCVAVFFFVILNRQAGIGGRFIPLELVLLFFNPLLFYQFWSAYPDSLFAGEVLLAFVLIDVIVTEHERDTRALILLLGLVIYAAILTKFYGMILGIACPAYLLLHLRPFLKKSAHVKSKLALLVAVFCVLGGALVLARLGRNPTLNLGVGLREGGGYSGYIAGLMHPSLGRMGDAIILLIMALGLNFTFLLFFLVKRGGGPRWPLAPTCFAGLFLLGLLPFPGSTYNMRFYLPLFPFVVVAIVSGMQNANNVLRRGVLVAYIGAAGFLTLNYNVTPLYELWRPFNERVVEPVLNKKRRLDNLRLDQHLSLLKKLEQINRVIEPSGTLYWASLYYGAATHGVIERVGLRSDIKVKYLDRTFRMPQTDNAIYVATYRFRGGRSKTNEGFAVTSLGSGVYRLVPLRVEITSPARDNFDQGETVLLKATASAAAKARVLRVEFLIDGLPVSADTEPPYEFDWRGAKKGRHVATARVHDSMGNIALSPARSIFVGIRALARFIARSEDDAEERGDGSMYLNSSDLELIEDGEDQVVGLRFADVRIPRGTQIREAYLQFTTDEVSAEQTDLTIHAELAGDAEAFTNGRQNISSRKRTSASVKWSPQPWRVIGERSTKQRTPDLSVLIREVIARPAWREGNALVFVITGSGKRVAESYDGAPGGMPELYIESR